MTISPIRPVVSFDDFTALDIRVGTIVQVKDFPEARKPAYKLWIDIGEGDIRKSSAQIVDHYTKSDLLHKQVVCVVNFPPRQIGPVKSEVLVTGFHDENGHVVLCIPEKPIKNGQNLA